MSLYRAVFSGYSSLGHHVSRNFASHGRLMSHSMSTIVPFKLADIGEGIAEVEIMKWFVKAGDSVKSFDKLCEVQSDKATVEITSRFSGKIVKVYNAEGEIAKVGSVLVDIETTGAPASSNAATKTAAAPTAPTPAAVSSTAASHSHSTSSALDASNSKVLTTPAVRKIAKENKIDLTKVPATGPKGRILKEDVLNILNGSAKLQSGSNEASSNSSSSSSNAAPIKNPFAKADQVIPVRGIGRLMVKSMNAANEIKHLTLGEEVDFNGMISLRKRLKPLATKQNVKLSYMPLLLKAVSLSLREHPSINATVNADATEITVHGSHNIGVAMDTPKGLIVPVIKNVELKTVWEIAKELNSLQEAAAKGTITEDQLKGGSFSLSNIGSVGGTYAVPVLVVPQVAIGAIGRILTNPKYVNSTGSLATLEEIEDGVATIAPVSTINISWSADHRVVDGAAVAKFSNTFKKYVENPDFMLVDMR